MMDLETYISRYRGETRLQRLLHIGKTASDSALVTQAYELAEMQMKDDGNVLRYKEVFGDGKLWFKNFYYEFIINARKGEWVWKRDKILRASFHLYSSVSGLFWLLMSPLEIFIVVIRINNLTITHESFDIRLTG